MRGKLRSPVWQMLALNLAVLGILASCASRSSAQEAKAKVKPKSADTFDSGGQKINLWRYEPDAPGKHPAILLLHGIDGVTGINPFYGVIAEDLAARGYVVHLVHYFDRTPEVKKLGTLGLLFALRKPLLEGKDDPKVEKLFTEWMAAIKDGVGYARKQQCIDGECVNLVGISLGGFLTLSLAVTEPDLKLNSISSLFGGLPRKLYADVKRLPPVLIIHGDKDTVVPVKEAEDLIALLKERKCVCEDKIYAGAGHGFLTPKGDIDLKQAEEAKELTLRFLAKHVKKAKPKSSPDPRPGPKTGRVNTYLDQCHGSKSATAIRATSCPLMISGTESPTR